MPYIQPIGYYNHSAGGELYGDFGAPEDFDWSQNFGSPAYYSRNQFIEPTADFNQLYIPEPPEFYTTYPSNSSARAYLPQAYYQDQSKPSGSNQTALPYPIHCTNRDAPSFPIQQALLPTCSNMPFFQAGFEHDSASSVEQHATAEMSYSDPALCSSVNESTLSSHISPSHYKNGTETVSTLNGDWGSALRRAFPPYTICNPMQPSDIFTTSTNTISSASSRPSFATHAAPKDSIGPIRTGYGRNRASAQTGHSSGKKSDSKFIIADPHSYSKSMEEKPTRIRSIAGTHQHGFVEAHDLQEDPHCRWVVGTDSLTNHPIHCMHDFSQEDRKAIIRHVNSHYTQLQDDDSLDSKAHVYHCFWDGCKSDGTKKAGFPRHFLSHTSIRSLCLHCGEALRRMDKERHHAKICAKNRAVKPKMLSESRRRYKSVEKKSSIYVVSSSTASS